MKLSPKAYEVRQRLVQDFDFYAKSCLKIRSKKGRILPFYMNDAQIKLHKILEQQLKKQGYTRCLVVKGRQQGISTYIAARYFWKLAHKTGTQAFALSHLEVASRNLMQMMLRFYEGCPVVMQPKLTEANKKSLSFGGLDSGYKIGTANSKGVGRSETVQLFHGSEVAYWANARDHISGILQSIPTSGQTEVILESTSNGPYGVFYDLCQTALNEQSSYKLVFLPWFMQTEYSAKVPKGLTLTNDEQEYAKKYKLSLAKMVWRREKIAELGGHWRFRREYPASIEEAFHNDTPGALWSRRNIEENRVLKKEAPKDFKRIVVAVDPAASHKKTSDETGIIVAGLAADDHVYILDDISGRLSPAAWAKAACDAYETYCADRIIVEANQGGEMAVHTLKTYNPCAPVKKLHASRGKWTRAEPVAALDEQGRIHHVGNFSLLEDQMCAFKPADMAFSPDRVDARVWAVTELLLDNKTQSPKMWQA